MYVFGIEPQVYTWQQPIWQHLQQRYPQLGHALLFYGKHGCGKRAFVEHFVAWLLCANQQADGACGQCQSCIWLKTDIHPHIMVIRPDEEEQKNKDKAKKPVIKIDKIREILPFVQQTLEGWRVIIIEPAEALNIAASNALLKTLEEPSERVILILLAEHYLKLPATIRSRTQHFALDRVSYQQAQQFLQTYLQQQNIQLSVQRQQLLLNLAESMPLYATELVNSEWLNYRAEFIQDWLKLSQHKHQPMFYAQKWQKIMSFNDFNSMFELLVCDIIRMKLQQPIYNIDLDLTALAQQCSLQMLFHLYDETQQNAINLGQNVQTQLMMEQYFIDMMNLSEIQDLR